MDMDAIKDHERGQILCESNIQTANRTNLIFIRAVGETEVRRNRKMCFTAQILACRAIEALAGWRSNPVRACPKNQGWSVCGLRDCKQICQRTRFSGSGVVLDSPG